MGRRQLRVSPYGPLVRRRARACGARRAARRRVLGAIRARRLCPRRLSRRRLRHAVRARGQCESLPRSRRRVRGGAHASRHRLRRGDRLADCRRAPQRAERAPRMTADRVRYRNRPKPADLPALRRLVESTGVFNPEERAVALELLAARLERGPKSGYSFFFAERRGELIGYAAWGDAPLTQR